MKNKLIIETLLILAIFTAGVGFGMGAYRIHDVRVMNEEIEQYKEAIARDYAKLYSQWDVAFTVRGGIGMFHNPCLSCHGEHE